MFRKIFFTFAFTHPVRLYHAITTNSRLELLVILSSPSIICPCSLTTSPHSCEDISILVWGQLGLPAWFSNQISQLRINRLHPILPQFFFFSFLFFGSIPLKRHTIKKLPLDWFSPKCPPLIFLSELNIGTTQFFPFLIFKPFLRYYTVHIRESYLLICAVLLALRINLPYLSCIPKIISRAREASR